MSALRRNSRRRWKRGDRPGGRETRTVRRRVGAELPLKGAPQSLLIAVTCLHSDDLERQVRFLKRSTRSLQPHQFHCLGWGAADLGGVGSGEGTRRHAPVFGEPLNRQIMHKIGRHPGVEFDKSSIARLS